MKFAAAFALLTASASLVSGAPAKCRPTHGSAPQGTPSTVPSYPHGSSGSSPQGTPSGHPSYPHGSNGSSPKGTPSGIPSYPHGSIGSSPKGTPSGVPSYPQGPNGSASSNLPGYSSVPSSASSVSAVSSSAPTSSPSGAPHYSHGVPSQSSIASSVSSSATSYPSGAPRYSHGVPAHSTTSGGVSPPTHAPIKNSMTILATNDIHAHLDAFNSGGTDCKPKDIAANNCVGGVARIATIVKQKRAESDNVVLLDAGDQFQGTLFFNVFGGEASGTLMNELKYDVMTIGNHEFDRGVQYAADFFKNLTFPVVSANIDLDTAKPLRAAGVKPYTILKDYGVGVIGYITNQTAAISTGVAGVTFQNPWPVVQKYVDELHAQGIKRVICLSHNGYSDDKYLAANTRGISLIVGGHSHSLLLTNSTIAGVEGPYPTVQKNLDGQDTYIVQSHRYGDYLGHVDIAWNDANELVSLKGESIRLDNSTAQDAAIQAQVDKYRQSFAALTAQIVGNATATFDQSLCHAGECAIGDLIAESMLVAAPHADAAFTNTGGIRASLTQGAISYADVVTVLPFGNVIVEFTYTGAQIVSLLERVFAGHDQTTQAPVVTNPQWAGLRVTYDPSKPEFSRVVSVEIGGKPIVPAQKYVVATNDFCAGGGDGIMNAILPPPPAGLVMADALIAYFEAHGVQTPTLDGRIKAI
ncbi:hypothetical protein HKX48_006589 [Thoreauomyces humboldtii]|nr:hypothetical protein HKX48_006589 [Thoreauomyces humboldtii]